MISWDFLFIFQWVKKIFRLILSQAIEFKNIFLLHALNRWVEGVDVIFTGKQFDQSDLHDFGPEPHTTTSCGLHGKSHWASFWTSGLFQHKYVNSSLVPGRKLLL